MIGRHQRDQPLLERHQRTEIRQIGRAEHQREIDLVIGEALHRLDVILHPHVEMHERKARAIGGDLARQKFEHQRLAGGDAHGAAAQALQILDLRAHAVEIGGLAADVMDEQFAGGGQPHAARTPLEQRRVEFGLQVHDPPVDGGGRDIEPLGGLADRSGPRDVVEIVQKSQMSHGLSPSASAIVERCRNGIAPARNQRQIVALNAPSVCPQVAGHARLQTCSSRGVWPPSPDNRSAS